MKILFVLEYYHPHIGGVEILFKTLAEGLVKKGHEVTVYTTMLKGYKKKEVVNGVKIVRKKIPFNSRFLFSFYTIFDVLKLSKNFDIIQTTTYNASLPSYIASKIRKKPVIITFHEILGKLWFNLPRINYFKALMLYLIEQSVMKRNFDKIVTVSNYTKNSLRIFGVKDKKLKRIYNFTDEGFFNPENEKFIEESKNIRLKFKEKHLFFSYGRPGVTKGFEYLIEGYKKFNDKNSRLILSISKSPKEGYDHIMNLIKKNNLEDKITILDPIPRDKLPSYILAMDTVIIPSLTEGFGFTTVEACMLKKPVIVTNTASIPEVSFGKVIFIEPSSPEEICEGMKKALRGEYEIINKKRFSKQEFIDNYEKEYKKLLGLF